MKRPSATVARAVVAMLFVVAFPVLEGAALTSAASARPRCTMVGSPGDDRLVGTSRRDVICGRGGSDRIVGRGGDDLVLGGRGRDRLVGGTGNDRLSGGDANDVLEGGDGTDVVLGGAGNDDLAGGRRADEIDGGAGTNWCLLDAADVADRCVYDEEPGVADQLTVSQDSVDVTLQDRLVTIRVHVTDDTGARFVRITPGEGTPWFPATNPELRTGDVRDGWWTATLTLRRWSMPGTYVPNVTVWDRLDRRSVTEFPESSIEVIDATPDTEQPSVTLTAPNPETVYDVRTTSALVKLRARIIDELSGVDDVEMCLWAPRINGAMSQAYCDNIRLTSGTIRDGIWTGSVSIPKGHVGGDWNFWIGVRDRARRESNDMLNYWGPGEFLGREGNPTVDRPFPNGMGSVNVIGRLRTDSTPPTVGEASLTPTVVDTLPGPATVNVTVQAADNDSGVDGISAQLIPPVEDGSQPMYIADNPDLTSGTPMNGTWTGAITLPQGLPPGTYYLKITIWDRETNMTSYIASGHPDAAYWTNQLSTNPTVTVIDSSS
jgi:hypothetical protein